MVVDPQFEAPGSEAEHRPARGTDPLASEKEVVFYSAVVDAWVSSRMERDRHLMGYSAGGVGLLVTLGTTVGAKTALELALYALGATAFLATMIGGLKVFARNARHLEAVLKGEREKDHVLDRLDALMVWSFGLGVVFAATLAVAAAWARL
jgi:hypothetical protein